ncbi:methyl-accepting chemotaxis protein [Estrella lausannensis]|uniref:Methyl-accepting chemotaxis protein n=1 Tax=Estrella lausannensis TaxID=483423 RepID=A0A0H5DRR2_9BACT|nr:methyl-accepting chemotaxis protein [Estrella lausannensis]CRX39297.1 Methyl-accepting chemotaxis protein [Estrella lausannensis]
MITIKARLIILAGFMSATILALGFYGWFSLQHALAGQERIYHGGVDATGELYQIGSKINHALFDAVKVYTKTMSWEEGEKSLKNVDESISSSVDAYHKLNLTQEQNSAWGRLAAGIQQVRGELKNLQVIYAKKDYETLEKFLQQAPSVFDPVQDQRILLIQMHLNETAKDFKEEVDEASQAVRVSFFLMAFGTIAGLLSAGLLIKNITDSLNYTINAVNQLAKGDTTVQIETKSKDEIEKLLLAMQRMIATTNLIIEALKAVSSGDLTATVVPRSEKDTLAIAVKDLINKLRQMISKVQSEVKTVVGSSHEIVTSVTQVSSNTAETAAAVTETTTTTEELKQTAHVASEKAQGVLDNAEETLKIVRTSEQSLGSTIADMLQIQEKMRTISESIIKLSENSQAIGAIIDTVNDLAEQSNLLAGKALAVNAAIEAARAGEQGKSFGVVAQEIRNLAEQSKSATIQVRSILNDIQNATSAAVMATEQGSKAVSKGVEQSSETAAAIKNLCFSIETVAQAAKQIALSSQQQLIGIDQVTVAMANINEASGQHVEHMRQIESSVLSLNSVGSTLKEIVEQYKMVV